MPLYNLSLICKVRNFLTADKLKMSMSSPILTYLDYSNAIHVNLPDAITKQLQLKHNFVAKLCSTRENSSVTEYLKELHWLPVKFRCIYKLLAIVYHYLRKERPTYLQTKLNVKHNQRSTRNSTQNNNTATLVTAFNRKKLYEDHRFIHTAAQQWNNLPSHIKNYYKY